MNDSRHQRYSRHYYSIPHYADQDAITPMFAVRPLHLPGRLRAHVRTETARRRGLLLAPPERDHGK
jgi:hypothetical protein